MPGMIVDDETERQLQGCDDSYRKVSLHLDLARLEYYQLRTVSSTDPQLGHLLEKIVQLVREREGLSSELDKLENLS